VQAAASPTAIANNPQRTFHMPDLLGLLAAMIA
jgi:hypothetical protein